MPSYIAINNSEIDPDSPITADLLTKFRDNPLAISTDDSSVPDALRFNGITLLGSLTTTSGSTQTLSGLTLTRYKFIRAVIKDVSGNNTGSSIRLNATNSGTIFTPALGSISDTIRAIADLDLVNQVYVSSGYVNSSGSGVATSYAGSFTTLSQAATSITFAISSGTFDAGTIYVYGMK